MGHVFISYSRVDQAHARRLTDDLRQHGFDVWIEDLIIEDGKRSQPNVFRDIILRAIEDASAVVVIMSPDSEQSKWVEKEYLYAEEQGKLVLPLRLKGHTFPYFANAEDNGLTESGGLSANFYERLRKVVAS